LSDAEVRKQIGQLKSAKPKLTGFIWWNPKATASTGMDVDPQDLSKFG
jgi:hypothetical protein